MSSQQMPLLRPMLRMLQLRKRAVLALRKAVAMMPVLRPTERAETRMGRTDSTVCSTRQRPGWMT